MSGGHAAVAVGGGVSARSESVVADVTVVIPTYERRDALRVALHSVYRQSTAPQSVIVVDDGSTDGTAEMVRAEFPGAQLYRQENQGVSAARNVGLSMVVTPWIAFLDSDDAWHPQKLARQFAALEAAPSLKICHTEEIWIRNGRRVNQMKKHAKSGGWLFERSLELCCISPSSVVLHRDLIETHGDFDESLPACEDYDLWLRLTAHEETLFIEDPLTIKTGGHADQLSRKYWGMDRFRIRAIEKLLHVGQLSPEQYSLALASLIRKLEILIGGARKRDNREVIDEYRPRLMHWKSVAGGE